MCMCNSCMPISYASSIGSQCCHTEKPPLKDLVLYSNKITSQWKELALQLDIPQEVVNTIDINNNEIKDKCYHMFNAWLQRTVDSCWCQFVLALRKVDLLDLANVIELKFIGKWLLVLCMYNLKLEHNIMLS